MRTFKILSLTLAMSVVFAGMAFAQQQENKATQEEKAAKKIEMMKTTLDLTPEQVAKLQELQANFAQKRKEANDDAVKLEIKEAYKAELKSVLTPEQYQMYQEQRKNKGECKHKDKEKKMEESAE